MIRALAVRSRKAGLLVGVAVLAAAACRKEVAVTTRTVTAYTPEACAANGSAYAEYSAYGDFDPSATAQTGYFFSAVGQTLPNVYGATRSLVITATETPDAAGKAQATWLGWGPVAASGDVNVLLTPTLVGCRLTTTVRPGTGSTMAPIGGEQVLLVGGIGDPTPPTYVARLDTGTVASLGSEDLQHIRAYASITAFGPGALIAGGFDGAQVRPEAEIYSTALGGIDRSVIVPLSTPRWQHGAVVLASGQTLLVGGLGAKEQSSVLASLEIIDPTVDQAIPEGLGTLQYPRAKPTVLRLSSGQILVAGGTDADGNPESAIEWFNADGTPSSMTPRSIAQGLGSEFFALEAGGALAVLTPPAGTTGAFQNVYVIEPTGAVVAATAIPEALSDPVLFGGAGGQPILWTGSTWLQWQPYAGDFQVLGVAANPPTNMGMPATSPDPGLAMWLDSSNAQLTLLRYDTTNAYSSLPGPLLDDETTDTTPDQLIQLVPDSTGALPFPPGPFPPAVFVTDRTYADVQVSVSTTNGTLPFVALRDSAGNELDVGGFDCTVPVSTSTADEMVVTRRDTSVTYTLGPTVSGSCTTPWGTGARLSVGLRGQTSTMATARDLLLTRLGEAQ